MNHESDLSGAVTSVRGEYRQGREVSGLYGDCGGRVLIAGASWPVAIHVVAAADPFNDRRIDPSSLDKLRQAYRSKCNNWRILATLMGRFRSAGSNSGYTSSNGEAMHMGFGHLGVFGAQIEIIAATDFAIVQ
jgi:hypothetical protein